MEFFPEADLILLEGFKYSTYPKIEIVRKGNSAESVCDPRYLAAIATNLDENKRKTLARIRNRKDCGGVKDSGTGTGQCRRYCGICPEVSAT